MTMRKFLKWAGVLLLACVLFSALLMAVGIAWGDLHETVHVSIGGDSVVINRIDELPWPHALAAWLAIAFAMLVVVTVVPMSLLFAAGVTALALAATAVLLLLPAMLLAAPFAFILWVIWFRKRKHAAAAPPPAAL
jgi:hypothetical protein